MPQASDELRAKMKSLFGDSIDAGPPLQHLEKNGWTYSIQTGNWRKPNAVPTTEECDCMQFLQDEWDY